MPVPNRNQWKRLKLAHGIPDGAVRGIDFGKELDKVDQAARGTNKDAYFVVLKQYATVANTYITKLDAKKVKNYGVFQKAFLNDYLGVAHKTIEGIKLEADGRKLYQSELRKFFSAVQKLATNPDAISVQKFSQFARGLTSVAKRVKDQNIDFTVINLELARIDAAQHKVGADASAEDIKAFVVTTKDVANRIRRSAKAQGLVSA